MPKLFVRTDTGTAKKTLAIFREEMVKDKKSVWIYSTLIPLNRLLYIVILPLFFSLIIQSLLTHPHDWRSPTVLLGASLVISLLALLTSWIGFRRLFIHEETMHTTLTRRAIEALMQHSDQFFANRKIGALAGDVNTFSNSVIAFLDVIFVQASSIIVNFTASLIVIGIMSPILLAPLGIVTGLIVWRAIVGAEKRGPLRHRRKVLTAQLNGTVADILGNQQLVRYFATDKREIERVVTDREEIEANTEIEIKILHHEATIRQAVLFIFQIITMAICIYLFINHSVSIAALVFAVTYLGRLTGSLFDLSPIIRGTEQAFLDAANVTDILAETPEVIDIPNAKKIKIKEGLITFKNVNFSYNDSENTTVIRKLSLNIAPGERIGLAGHSGGGKTTLTKLILRFANLTAGSISIDGQDISKVTQESLRSAIAYVPQEPYLFHRSLRENVAYARPDATDEEIMQAITRANARDFVDALPKGLDTLVGERGVKLSGGQRQRIAIARAILKDAPILILDEATSALDSESEMLIQQALTELMKNRTSIVVAHRLSTIAQLDRILVLDKGRVVESGPHKILVKQKGTYAKLWAHQSGGFIEE
jgi:ATP-binding cassette subfamily B protein